MHGEPKSSVTLHSCIQESYWKLPLQKGTGWAVGRQVSPLLGADSCDTTSITHCQILPFNPTPLICAEVSPLDLRAHDIWLRRCDVTTLSYITALSNSFSAKPGRWACIAKSGNGFSTVSWDIISPSTASITGSLLTNEPTAPFPR